MAYTPKILYPSGFPTNAGNTIYTVPNGTTAILKNIVMTNTTANDATVHLSIVPSGGTPAASNRILSDLNVPSFGINTLDVSVVMPAGTSLFATNNTDSAVVMTISGVEFV